LAAPGVPETREYMARGMIADDETGLESDIVSINWLIASAARRQLALTAR